MSTVLTIDFDIIMSPSIQLYNDLIGDRKGVNKIIKQYPLMEYIMAPDFFIYENLTRELVRLFKRLPTDKVFFISEHDSVISLTKDLKEFKLVNIDHHHDIGYDKTTATTKILYPDCGNWVKYLSDKGKITEYVWVNNSNSDKPNDSLLRAYLGAFLEIKEFDFESIQDIDRLIICNSPQWIPPNSQALYMAWVGIAEEFYERNFKIQ